MTALDQYQRLEALALWRADATSSPREVIATFGNSRLTLMDMSEAPITQWSLAALRYSEEADPAGRPDAVGLTPDPEGAECLWFDDVDLKAAIAAVWIEEEAEAVDAAPSGNRVFRYVILAFVSIALVIGAILARPWAQDTLLAQVPEEVWRSVSREIVTAQSEQSGLYLCQRAGRADPALMEIQTRLGATQARMEPVLFTARQDVSPIIALPDHRVLLDADAMRSAAQPEALAGLMALGLARQDREQPRNRIASAIGMGGLIGLVTRGYLSEDTVAVAAAALAQLPEWERPADAEALRLLETAALPSKPLALILAGRGLPIERLEALADGDVIGAEPFTPALNDQTWLGLRSRCPAR
ncbi:hypothetical protein [Pontivivens insulae]|uniref:Peptidase M48 domain-containing protein n=1 Tax=Pontivivens insulae TaxID=1639689 RepID=A0A2R8ADW6_9RHOB|nr:hypothetical protein [Pontivivens insulae]RED14193.1 hypothetical protein DFR53_1549 [Pontivivens insulae]SPF30268.1 hypothetical protein POI8812_02604 [Pontivivens insulae]